MGTLNRLLSPIARERIASGVTTRYNWDVGWNVISEENAAGALTNTYIHAPSRPIGTILADVAGANPATGAYRYYSQDNLGSTRRLRDQNKASLGQYEYEPYGTVYSEIGPAITHKFTGHDWDYTAQLYFAPYRYYAPTLARWMTRDPLGMVDGPNLGSYAGNNPISKVDIEGDLIIAVALAWMACSPIIGGVNRIYYDGMSGTGGSTNDDYKHCVTACRMSRYCVNPLSSGLTGILQEWLDYTGDGEELIRDMCSNADGLKCSARLLQSCSSCCKKLGYNPGAPHNAPHPRCCK